MGTIQLPPDFKEFLKLLNSARVEYLLVGGYAVCHYAEPRLTGDLDVWVSTFAPNANALSQALQAFGFATASVSAPIFQHPNQVFRMGVPPMRIKVLTSVTGLEVSEAYARRATTNIDGVQADVIALADLKVNKRAAGRPKDLLDLRNLG